MPTWTGRHGGVRHVWVPPRERPQDIAHARAWVAELLRAHQRDDLIDDAKLIVTELAANALHHAGGICRVVATMCGSGAFVVSVEDGSRCLPEAVRDPAAEHGRGLLLVAALAADWGAERIPGAGKRVTATLSTVAAEPEQAA